MKTFNAKNKYYVRYCRWKRFNRKCLNKEISEYNCIVFVSCFTNSFRLIAFASFFLEADSYSFIVCYPVHLTVKTEQLISKKLTILDRLSPHPLWTLTFCRLNPHSHKLYGVLCENFPTAVFSLSRVRYTLAVFGNMQTQNNRNDARCWDCNL